jgi:pimeloyl-ACP methyl ester carboxylesterase
LASPGPRPKLALLTLRRTTPAAWILPLALAAGALLLAPEPVASSSTRVSPAKKVRVWTIHYRAHNGARRAAHVLLPAWYGRKHHPPLPLVISPHGRGVTGRENLAIWGRLPARGPFAVVSPDGQGRRLPNHSWGYSGQIDDLARMPEILRRTLPWLRIDRKRVYAFGGSMGGQETLLLVARHPDVLAGAAAFDSVTDFARQYRHFMRLSCTAACKRVWGKRWGRMLRKLARHEVGGSPKSNPTRYAVRSPATYVRRIAFSCVPLQLWWSVADRIVTGQKHQTGSFFWEIRRLNPDAPVHAFVGNWIHSSTMRATSGLPLALATFGLLPPTVTWQTEGLHVVSARPSSEYCSPQLTR